MKLREMVESAGTNCLVALGCWIIYLLNLSRLISNPSRARRRTKPKWIWMSQNGTSTDILKSICVNTLDILKVTNTPVDWWICFETSPVCTFSPEFVGHRHRQKTNICCLAPGVGSRCDIIVVFCWRVWQDECLPWISTSQTNPGCFDLEFWSVFRCIMQHELGDKLQHVVGVKRLGLQDGWKTLDNFEGVSFAGQFFLQAVGVL